MTLRGLALRSLVLSGICALVLVGASNAKLGFYTNLERQADRLLLEAARALPVKVPTDTMSRYRPPSQKIFKVIEISRQGRVLRVHYFQIGVQQVVDSLGDNAKLVRRDIYYQNRIRVQKFYEQDGALQEVHFLNAAGSVLRREVPRVAPPPPGWVY